MQSVMLDLCLDYIPSDIAANLYNDHKFPICVLIDYAWETQKKQNSQGYLEI